MDNDLPGSINDNSLARGIHRVGSKAHEAVDRVESTAASAANSLGDKADRLIQAPTRHYDATCEAIAQKPLQSVAIAAGVGLVLGWLCGMSSHRTARY